MTTGDRPVAEIEFTARILGEDGAIVAPQLFRATEPTRVRDAAAAAAALDTAFGKAAADLVVWTSAAL